MSEELLYCLDARTMDGARRLTVFSDKYTGLVDQYKSWVDRNELSEADIWYADVFDVDTHKRTCKFLIQPDYIEVVPCMKEKQPSRIKIRAIELLKRKLRR